VALDIGHLTLRLADHVAGCSFCQFRWCVWPPDTASDMNEMPVACQLLVRQLPSGWPLTFYFSHAAGLLMYMLVLVVTWRKRAQNAFPNYAAGCAATSAAFCLLKDGTLCEITAVGSEIFCQSCQIVRRCAIMFQFYTARQYHAKCAQAVIAAVCLYACAASFCGLSGQGNLLLS